MNVENTKNIESQKLKVLIYGESGSGKTRRAETLDGKTLIISAEQGLLSLSGKDIDVIDLSVEIDENKKRVSIPISQPERRLKKLQDTFNWLQAGTNYKNVFVDSLTEINELVLAGLKKQFPDRKDSLVMWSENASKMQSMIKSFRDLDYNVYMTCLAETDKDENNRRYMGFNVSGKLAKQLPQYFDEVFYLFVDENGNRKFVTNKTDVHQCKDRSGKLEKIENADLGAIAAKILIKKEEKK